MWHDALRIQGEAAIVKKIAFPRRRRHGTIRTRLIVSFSVPVLAVMLLVMIGVYRILLSGSEAQVLSFARSSYDQSYELVSSYIEMMLYASDSIYYNGDLQRILSRRDYAEEMPIDERYREFLVLDDVFPQRKCRYDLPHRYLSAWGHPLHKQQYAYHVAGNAF